MTRTTIQPLILIVEDEADIVTFVAYNLEKKGFRTAARVKRHSNGTPYRR